MKLYFYISGNMGMTSSGSFTRNFRKWIVFNNQDIMELGKNRPYGATKAGIFIVTSKYM